MQNPCLRLLLAREVVPLDAAEHHTLAVHAQQLRVQQGWEHIAVAVVDEPGNPKRAPQDVVAHLTQGEGGLDPLESWPLPARDGGTVTASAVGPEAEHGGGHC